MTETTRLRPSWRNRTIIIAVVLLAFGLWGAYDAAIAYPARGTKVAEKLEHNYLTMAKRGDADRQLRADEVSVPEPRKALDSLTARMTSHDPPLSEFEASRLRWLDALPVVGLLSEEHTVYTDAPRDAAQDAQAHPRDPNVRFAQLDERWAGVSPPKPLHSYDLLFQWIIFAVCWALGLLFVGTMISTTINKYRWDQDSHTLTLPNGVQLVPADLVDLDKRKWHKFFVFLKIRPDHPERARLHGSFLGRSLRSCLHMLTSLLHSLTKVVPVYTTGEGLKVDLFRRDRLEGWILEMEKIAFPDRAEPEPNEPEPVPTEDQAPPAADA